LVEEAAIKRDLGERGLRRQHQLLGAFNAPVLYVRLRWLTERCPEDPAEVAVAEAYLASHLFDFD
jgi:hypothetical protein